MPVLRVEPFAKVSPRVLPRAIRLLPRAMAEELAAELGFLDNPASGRVWRSSSLFNNTTFVWTHLSLCLQRGMLSKVPMFDGLGSHELMLIGSRLQHVRTQMHTKTSVTGATATDHDATMSAADDRDSFVMRQGERDDRMFLIVEGMVRVVRSDGDDDAAKGDGSWNDSNQLNLGKLRQGDYMGELAVLVEEAPGLPFKRQRSAFAITGTCVLCTLSYRDMQQLRAISPLINTLVGETVSQVLRKRPSLGCSGAVMADATAVAGGVVAGGGGGDSTSDRLARIELDNQEMKIKLDHLLNLLQTQRTN